MILCKTKIKFALHHAFNNSRINPSREFFDIDESQAIVILKLITTEDVTPVVAVELDKVDMISRKAGDSYSKSRRPQQNFIEMGIPIGGVLTSADGEFQCTVAPALRLQFEWQSLLKRQSQRRRFSKGGPQEPRLKFPKTSAAVPRLKIKRRLP